MPLLDHTHSYIFWKIFGGERTFKCSHPDCSETRVGSYLLGKRGLCSICMLNPLIYAKQDLRRSKPRCPECSNTKENQAKRRIKSVLEGLNEFSIPKKEEEEPDAQL